MDYKLTDYAVGDYITYFEGCDVLFDNDGTPLCGTITSITARSATIQVGRQSFHVKLGDIKWNGIPSHQLIVHLNKTYLAAPIGIRHHKKGLTRKGLSVVGVSLDGHRTMFNTDVDGKVHEGVYNKFINYPDQINTEAMMQFVNQGGVRNARWVQFGPHACVRCHYRSVIILYGQGLKTYSQGYEDNVTEEDIDELVKRVYG